VPHLPALAHRRARPLLRRHPVQCRRRQLPQRRQPGDLYNTFVEQLARLPENTRVYPGHDYIENNLRFTLAREPDNAAAKALLPEVVGHDPATGRVTTMAEEKKVNTFLRLAQPERDRGAARGLPRPAREPGSEDGVRQVARTAQLLVTARLPPRRGDASRQRRPQVPQKVR
jgi:hypothetical protein